MKRETQEWLIEGVQCVRKEGLIFLRWEMRYAVGFPDGSVVKNLPTMQETQVQFLSWEDPLDKDMATHASTLAWRIPWTEEPGGLQSLGSHRIGHD